MREAGCFGVKLGFESGNQWVVDNIVKGETEVDRHYTIIDVAARSTARTGTA